MLTQLSLLATFTITAGVPLTPQDILVQWVPNSPKSLSREAFDFLDPFSDATKRQAATGCLLVIFISILVSLGMSDSKDTTNKWDAFESRLMRLTYGLLAPDYVAMSARRQQNIASEVANTYNREFPTEDPHKKWSGVHGRFALEGGFTLWEDNKPTATLKPGALIRMIKAGEVDALTVSKEDILAKTNRYNVLAPWLIYIFILWFAVKFPVSCFPFCTLALMYVWSAWYAYFTQNDTMRNVRQTIPVYRKAREKYGEKEPHDAHQVKSQDGKSSEEAEFSGIGFDVEPHSVHPSLAKLENSLSRGLELRCQGISMHWDNVSGSGYWSLAKSYIAVGVVHLPALAITASAYVTCQILHRLLSILINIFGACTVPMRFQWKLMCSENMGDLNKISVGPGGLMVSFISWGSPLLNTQFINFTSRTEQYIWYSSMIFLLIQPLILWLSAPHRRWMQKLNVGETMKDIIFCLWCSAYFVARFAIFSIAFWSLGEAFSQ